jgi:hypothetical protein
VYTLYNCDSEVQHTYQDVRLDGGVRVRVRVRVRAARTKVCGSVEGCKVTVVEGFSGGPKLD